MKQYVYKALCAATVGSFLCSCSGTYEAMNHAAGLGVIKSKESTFDGSKVISMTPSILYRKELIGESFQMGATWTESNPNMIGLHIVHNSSTRSARSYLSIQGMDINIDGNITHHKTTSLTSFDNSGYNTVAKTIYTKSHNTVIISLSKLEKMLAANDCRLRIRTSRGSHDRIFSREKNGGAPLAKYDLKKFIAKINSAR